MPLYQDTVNAIVKVAAQWLGEQDYLRSFQVDRTPDSVYVRMVANNFFYEVRIDIGRTMDEPRSLSASVLRELYEAGAYITRKLDHVADPNRLPG